MDTNSKEGICCRAGLPTVSSEQYWLAAEAATLAGAAGTALWAQLRQDARIAATAATLAALFATLLAFHERSRRQVEDYLQPPLRRVFGGIPTPLLLPQP